MFANRNLKRDLFALAIAAAAAFIGVSLATYSPADAVSMDPAVERYNVFGAVGAVVASFLISALGISANFLVAALVCISFWMLRNEEIELPAMRTVGGILSAVGLSCFAALLFPQMIASFEQGTGGRLGEVLGGLLLDQFSLPGAVIVTSFVTVAGLLMFSDYALLHFAQWSFAGLMTLPQSLGLSTEKKTARNRKSGRPAKGAAAKRLDEDDDDEYEEIEDYEDEVEDEAADEEALTIRFPGRQRARSKQVADGEDSEAVQQEIEWEEDSGEEAEELDEVETVEPEEAEPVVKRKKKPKKSKVHSSPHFKPKQKAPDEREVVMEQLNQAALVQPEGEYELPTIDLLMEGDDISFDEQEKEVRTKARILEKTFSQFGFNVKVVEIETGPVIAQYEIELEAGLRLSKIMGLADDLAIALRVPSVRIVAPIPGKNTVGIEVPNEARQMVRLRDVMEEGATKTSKMKIPLFLGKDVSGNPLVADLATLPHLLIAGRTGTGKSVCLNAIISSILMTRRPDEIRMLMIDPKMVELSGYGRLPHLMHPVVTDMRKAEAILAWAVDKMEERYSLLARAGVRHITSYNQLGEEELMERLEIDDPDERERVPLHLPFIVIVADEMADLMMTAGKDVEQHIIRLAQKSRAVGIHLILATQKPTVDVITGLIKSNLPARISFQVASRTDSRVVLDEMGADKLLGNGDMLFLWPGTSKLLRGQGTYLSDEEIDSITDACSQGEQQFVNELLNLKVKEEESDGKPASLKNRDELYESAVDVVVREGRGSVSLLQRCLGIGYGRAARLIDYMAEDNIVGPYNGAQAREVLVTVSDWEAMQGMESEPDASKSPLEKITEINQTLKAQADSANASEQELEEDEEYEEVWDDEEDPDGDAEGAADDEEYEDDEDYSDDDEEYEYVYEDDDEEEDEYEESA